MICSAISSSPLRSSGCTSGIGGRPGAMTTVIAQDEIHADPARQQGGPENRHGHDHRADPERRQHEARDPAADLRIGQREQRHISR